MRKQQWTKLFLTLLAGFSMFGVATQASAKSKSKVIDVSQYQGQINWSKTAKSTKLAIIRVRHEGQKNPNDTLSNQNANGALRHGVAFGQYAFANFTSVADAKREAKIFYNLSNKNTKFYVLDNERRPAGAKGTENQFMKAWVNQMHKLTNKKLILYSGDYFAQSHHLNKSIFDGTWIAKYSNSKPAFSADLWQYTANGRVAGIQGPVDQSKILNSAAVKSWLSPRVTKPTVQPRTVSKKVAKYYHKLSANKQVQVLTKIREYRDANFKQKTKKTVKVGKKLSVTKVVRSKGGAYRFMLTNGKYITANKQNVKIA